MSHNIMHSSYPENVNKGRVQAEWDEYVAREDWQEGCNGLDNKIRWLDFVCADEESAYDYIEKHDRGWYDCLAVKYKVAENVKPTKKLEDLYRRYKATELQLKELRSDTYFKGFKSQFLGCKKCNSKINKDYIIGYKCPVCHDDMRSDTVKGNEARLCELLKKLKSEIRLEEKRLNEKASKKACQIRWLVKIEYHT